MARYLIEYRDRDGIWQTPGAYDDSLAATEAEAEEAIEQLRNRPYSEYAEATFRVTAV